MIWVVFGGQYGSEGKGAFCAYLARGYGFRAAVRGGGPQAGHTFYEPQFGGKCVVRQVPVACVVDRYCLGYIGPGAVVDLDVLEREIAKYELAGRVFVHPNAAVLEPEHKKREAGLEMAGFIPGSTKEGTGSARSDRAVRRGKLIGQIEFVPGGRPGYVDWDLKVYDRILSFCALQDRVMVEGTQGFGLSLYHGFYPYVTSADTTPTAALSEAGLPVYAVERCVAVLRTFPIRVGGESGPFQSSEISWQELGQPPETTTVTSRTRRVAQFEWSEFDRMLAVCRPTHAALMFCDYLDPAIRENPITKVPKVWDFWRRVNKRLPCPWIGVGGDQFEVRGAMSGVTMGLQFDKEARDGRA